VTGFVTKWQSDVFILREKWLTGAGLFGDRLGFVREKGHSLEQTPSKPATGTAQKNACRRFQNNARNVLPHYAILKKSIKKPPVAQAVIR